MAERLQAVPLEPLGPSSHPGMSSPSSDDLGEACRPLWPSTSLIFGVAFPHLCHTSSTQITLMQCLVLDVGGLFLVYFFL